MSSIQRTYTPDGTVSEVHLEHMLAHIKHVDDRRKKNRLKRALGLRGPQPPDKTRLENKMSQTIRDYTDSGYKDDNTALRTNPGKGYMSSYRASKVWQLNARLMIFPHFVGTSYRASPHGPFKPERIFVDRGFLSTTANGISYVKHVMGDAYKHDAGCGSVTFNACKFFIVSGFTGRHIEQQSEYITESEVLFPAGTLFRVVNNFTKPSSFEGSTVVVLEEPPPELLRGYLYEDLGVSV